MRLVRVLCLVGVLGSVLSSSSSAQIGTMAIGSVKVTPDNGGPLLVAPNLPTNWAQFTVENKFDTQQTFELSCSRTGTATGCAVDLEAVTLAAGASTVVPVSFSTGASTGSGTLTLRADGIAWDTGSYAVSVVTPVAPTVALVNASGDSWDKGVCLTLGAGEAAVQCGDLLVAHGLPAIRTLGQDRAPTLVYSSRQAMPQYIVAANVTQPSGKPLPTQVVVRLKRSGVTLATSTYMGSSWPAPGSSRQVVMAGSDTMPTGVYALTLEVENQHGPAVNVSTSSATVAIVNRRTSRFGRGWWLAGLEQLVLAQPAGGNGILWVGADGSADLYSLVAANTWVAPQAAFRDTITWNAGTSRYVRKLRHGVEVHYSATGRHLETRNRVGHRTTFAWTGDSLLGITVPPQGVGGTSFTLAYTGGRLTQLTDPTGRALVLTDSSGSVSKVRDPDLRYTYFGYDASGRMTARKGRGGYTTRYEYANGLRVTKFKVPYGPTGTDTAVTVVNSWDERGLGNGLAADTTLRYTEVLGPRVGVADDAKFWVDRWGQPTKVVDALGATTLLSRGDAARPALVTKVTHPNGRVDSTRYNTRGNPDTTRMITSGVAGGQLPTRITAYEYADLDALDSPSKVTDALGRFTSYAYGSLGLTETVTDPRGLVTTFSYTPDTLLKDRVIQISEASVPVWRQSDSTEVPNTTLQTTFTYDAVGNLKTSTAPTGVITSYVNDAQGRVADVYDPLGMRTHRDYDALNRLTQQTAYTTPQSHPGGVQPLAGCAGSAWITCADSSRATNLPATLVTQFVQGAVAVEEVEDPRGVTRQFSVDPRGLPATETDDYNKVKRAYYNAAGLVDSLRLRGGDLVRLTYDAAGRRTSVRYPAHAYGCAIDPPAIPLIHCAERYWTVPGDSIGYSYDIMGNLLEVTNQHGYVRRSYYGDGSLKSQVSDVQVLDSLAYGYDEVGARTRFVHVTDGGAVDSVRYHYNGASGDLDSLVARWGGESGDYAAPRRFAFTWDKLGRRRQVTYPARASDMTVTYRYGKDGVLRQVESVHPGAPGDGVDRLDFTLKHRLVDPVGRILHQMMECAGSGVPGVPCGGSSVANTRFAYDRQGNMVLQLANGVLDSMRYDASANLIWQRRNQQNPADSFYIAAGHNRLEGQITAGLDPLTIVYNDDGSRLSEFTDPGNMRNRFYYYDGMGRQSGVMNWVNLDGTIVVHDDPNGCLYDPDGQIAAPCDDGAPWLRYDGANVVTAAGQLWHFVHGPGLDDPMVGFQRWTSGQRTELFYVTDGRGRQYALGTYNGWFDDAYDTVHGYKGWQWAGGTKYSYTFGADRMTGASLPGLSFFRNRVYDQTTGRWTQEDPIGIAGGMNLYQFNGNNPATYTDPFGLCPDEEDPDCQGSFAQEVWNRVRSSADGVYRKLLGPLGPSAGRKAEQMAEAISSPEHWEVEFDIQAGPLVVTNDNPFDATWETPSVTGSLELSTRVRVSFEANPGASGQRISVGPSFANGFAASATLDWAGGSLNGASVSAGVGVGIPLGLVGRLTSTLSAEKTW